MREIKFRGVSKRLDKFVYGFFLMCSGKNGEYQAIKDTPSNINNGICDIIPTEIISGTEGQFTGLKDKTGVEIYEGDVVECFSPYGGIFKAEVVFVDGCFEINEPKGKDGVYRDYLKCLTCNHAIAVIGNIHENPDILGGE